MSYNDKESVRDGRLFHLSAEYRMGNLGHKNGAAALVDSSSTFATAPSLYFVEFSCQSISDFYF